MLSLEADAVMDNVPTFPPRAGVQSVVSQSLGDDAAWRMLQSRLLPL